MTTDDLSDKIVISLCDGRRLGHICNYDVDLCDGRITAVYLPGEGGLLGFGRSEPIRVPWEKLRKIGEDAILADVPGAIPHACPRPPKRKWFRP